MRNRNGKILQIVLSGATDLKISSFVIFIFGIYVTSHILGGGVYVFI